MYTKTRFTIKEPVDFYDLVVAVQRGSKRRMQVMVGSDSLVISGAKDDVIVKARMPLDRGGPSSVHEIVRLEVLTKVPHVFSVDALDMLGSV